MAFVVPLAMAAASAIGSGAAAVGSAAAGIGSAIGSALPALGAAGSQVPAWVGYASLGASALGGVTGAVGAYQQGQAEAGAARYNASMARQNAAIAEQNAAIAGQSGEQQAAMQEQKTRATVGAIKAGQAAAGVDVSTGSAVDVRSSAAELGELDALTVRSNAAREAFGYRQQAVGMKAESALDEYQAETAGTAGEIGAASTLLGGLGSAASKYYAYKLQGGFGG